MTVQYPSGDHIEAAKARSADHAHPVVCWVVRQPWPDEYARDDSPTHSWTVYLLAHDLLMRWKKLRLAVNLHPSTTRLLGPLRVADESAEPVRWEVAVGSTPLVDALRDRLRPDFTEAGVVLRIHDDGAVVGADSWPEAERHELLDVLGQVAK